MDGSAKFENGIVLVDHLADNTGPQHQLTGRYWRVTFSLGPWRCAEPHRHSLRATRA
jgi:hypothetical protein